MSLEHREQISNSREKQNTPRAGTKNEELQEQ